MELFVIDVNQQKLVQVSSSCRYIAVSYVRGNLCIPETTKINLEKRMVSNSLSSLTGIQTILDEIEATRRLGESYLWCDALCIVNDDPQHKHSQINSMDIIYSQALFTIAAISGIDANAGLPGVSRDFTSERIIEDIRCKWIIPQAPHLVSVLPHTLYETRGWTLQERGLSKRCIYFTEDSVYARCNLEVVCINDAGRTLIHNDYLNDRGQEVDYLSLFSFKYHPVSSYRDLVKMYSRREFSYPKDVLGAFSGIAHNWTQNYSTSSHTCHISFGLPESFIYIALLWQPIPGFPFGRRTISDQTAFFPSWSWAGWIGPVKPISAIRHMQAHNPESFFAWDMNNYESHNTPPMIEDENGNLRLIRIASAQETNRTFSHYELQESTQRKPLAPSRSGISTPETAEPTGQPGILHLSANTVDASLFTTGWNNRIFEIEDDSKQSATSGSRGQLSDGKDPQSRRSSGILFNADTAILLDEDAAKNMQFIRISSDRAKLDMVKLNAYEADPVHGVPDRFQDCIHVLLIEWREKFAERIAIGVMTLEAWNRAVPKREYIKLG